MQLSVMFLIKQNIAMGATACSTDYACT